jgi:transcriptional regulator with XRE-family HTH domain
MNRPVVATCIGRRIRELRRDAEMSVAELARRTDLYGPIVCRIERGVHLIDLRTAARIAHALELDVATLLVCLDERWIQAGQTGRGANPCV